MSQNLPDSGVTTVQTEVDPTTLDRASRRRRINASRDVAPLPIRLLKGLVLVLCCAAVVIPFLGIVSTSLATQEQVTAAGGFVLIPTEISLASYRSILAGGVVTQAMLVSVFVTVVGTAIALATSTMLAYTLSRPGAFGQKPMLILVLVSLLFAPGLIPNYLVVKELGLLDSLWALIIPTALSGFNVVVLRAFFMGIPDELTDSARIDGAGHLNVFLRVVLPLSKAVLSVIGLFYAVGFWNSFFSALLYLNDSAKWPLQLVLRTYVVDNAQLGASDLGSAAEVLPPQASIQMAILVVTIVPILLVYPFLQRHFASGVLTGAVKG